MRISDKKHISLRTYFGILALLFTAIGGNHTAHARSEPLIKLEPPAQNHPQYIASIDFKDDAPILLFSPKDSVWIPAQFAQTKPGDEFCFQGQLYRVSESGKASRISDIDAVKLFEADRPYDKTGRQAKTFDVVQVLDKNMEFIEHALLCNTQSDTAIRFQGRTYTVKPDRSLSETGTIFWASNSSLQRIEVTKGALQHITDRHTIRGTTTAGKSIFNAGEDIQALINNAELIVPVAQSDGRCQRILNYGRMIGTDGITGRQISTYMVITTQSGVLVTAYPYAIRSKNKWELK